MRHALKARILDRLNGPDTRSGSVGVVDPPLGERTGPPVPERGGEGATATVDCSPLAVATMEPPEHRMASHSAGGTCSSKAFPLARTGTSRG